MLENRQPGKLAVILHADIAGSTALVQQDEHLAHQRIQDTFRRFSDFITRYHGRVRELRGDALLAEFERASDSVSATLAFQASQAEYTTQFDDNILPRVRVGIAMGEVIIADDTITGEGVVLAQRVEQLADPGGVCITGAIHEALPRRMPFDQDDLGEQEVKGFDELVRVYAVRLRQNAELPVPTVASEIKRTSAVQWVMAAAVVVLICGGGILAWLQPWKPDFEPASVEQMSFPLPDDPSIAVLPFENYSDDPKMEFFANGLTEDLTTAFSRSPWLFVIARNSAATYKDKPVNVKQIAEDLGIQYVLEGSVQKAGNDLRITTQLVDALSGKHLWAGRFDRPASDIFAVQDEITKRVLTELQVELTMGDSARVRSHGTENLDAWLLQLEGYSEMNKWTRDSLIRARELYAAAFESDPNWAWPLAGTAITHWFDAKQGWSESREESIRLGFESAERAIGIDPNGALGLNALANMYFLTNQPEQGTEFARKAIKLAPNDFSMVAGMAMRIKDYGQEKEAIVLFEHATRLSPKHPWWVPFGYGLALHLVGRKEEAVETYKQAIGLGAQNARTYARLASVYVDMGRMDDARAAIKEGLRLEPNYTAGHYTKAYPMHDPKRDAWYKNLLVQAGLPEHPPFKLPDKPSIAVLPFTNMSGDPDQEYFADGMTDDLITDISKISGLFVVSRNSSFAYKGQSPDVRKVSEELSVRYVLEGSVRRAGANVRINAQLIDATTGGHIWAERFDGNMADVFTIQDEVNRKIVSALAVNLTQNDRERLDQKRTSSPDAYDMLLRGLELFQRFTPEDNAEARDFFKKAAALDPSYARAYANLSWSHTGDVNMNWTKNHDESIKLGEEYAKQALALDDSIPQIHLSLSALYLAQRQHDAAVTEARKTLDLHPNYADGYAVLAFVSLHAGELEVALTSIHAAKRLNPKYTYIYLFLEGHIHLLMRQYEQAISLLQEAAERNPVFDRTHVLLAAAYGQLDKLEDAEWAVTEALFINPEISIANEQRNANYKRPEHLELYLDGLRKAGLPE